MRKRRSGMAFSIATRTSDIDDMPPMKPLPCHSGNSAPPQMMNTAGEITGVHVMRGARDTGLLSWPGRGVPA